jgi:hypothetical protein
MERNYANLLLFVIIMISYQAKAVIITAIDGPGQDNWNVDATWDLGRQPVCGDTIVIPEGVTVHVPANFTGFENCTTTHIIVAGKLQFANGTNFVLGAGSCIDFTETGSLIPSAANKAKGHVTIGETLEWTVSDGTWNGPGDIGCATVLPVELLSFSLEIINNFVEISFATASEREIDYFVVEVSRNGSYWQEVATVKAAGNSTTTNTYTVTDKNPFNGTSYYRLKDVSFDGAVYNLEIITCEYTSTKYLVYPVPVNKLMFLEGEKLSTSEVYVVNSVGEKVEVEMSPLGDKLSFNFENIKSGIYFLKIQSENVKRTERITVVHK